MSVPNISLYKVVCRQNSISVSVNMSMEIVYKIFPLSYYTCRCLHHLDTAGSGTISPQPGLTVLDFKTWFKATRGVDIHRQELIIPHNFAKYEHKECKGDYWHETARGQVLQNDAVFEEQDTSKVFLLFILKLTREEKAKIDKTTCKYHTERYCIACEDFRNF